MLTTNRFIQKRGGGGRRVSGGDHGFTYPDAGEAAQPREQLSLLRACFAQKLEEDESKGPGGAGGGRANNLASGAKGRFIQ